MNQLKAGALLNYVLLGLNSLVGLLYTPYMLRMMGQSEYGLYSLVASVIAYITIMDFGFGNAIVRYTAKFRAEGKIREQYSMFGMFLILYSVVGILAFGAGLGLYFNVDALFGNAMSVEEIARAKVLMLILSFNLAATFPLSIFGAIITAYEDFVFQKVVQIIRILLNTVVMVCLLKMGYKAIAMVIVQTVFNMATLLLNYYYCRYKIRIRLFFGKFQWGFLREIGIYSFWIFLNVIMDRIYWSTGQFVLGAAAGTVAVAVFAVAIQLEAMYMQFSSAIANVFLPKVTAMVATRRTDREISDLFIRTGRIQFIIIGFILSGFCLFGRQFIILWAGPGYEDAYIFALLFFVSLTIPLIQNIGVSILQARNQMKFRSLMYIVIAVCSLLGQIVLSKYWGSLGCAVAIAAALLLGQGLIMNIYYHRVQKIDIVSFWREIAKMSLIPVALVIVGKIGLTFFSYSGAIALGIGIVCFTAIYVPAFWFGGMNEYERKLVREPIGRMARGVLRPDKP